jgi:hypothetical protein
MTEAPGLPDMRAVEHHEIIAVAEIPDGVRFNPSSGCPSHSIANPSRSGSSLAAAAASAL